MQEQEQDRLLACLATHQKKWYRCHWGKRGKIKTCRLFKYPDGLLIETRLDFRYGRICKNLGDDEEKTAVGVLALAGGPLSPSAPYLGYPRNYPLLIPANSPHIATFKKQAERLKRKAEPNSAVVFEK